MLNDFYPGLGRIALVSVVICAGVLVFIASTRGSPAPVPQDAMDGVYENAGCPSFTINKGSLHFGGGTIAGKVEVGRSAYHLAAAKSLRYQSGPDGCRLLVVEGRANMRAERQSFASPMVMIRLFSTETGQSMFWTRQAPGGEKKP